eukprot:177924-Karenia_brevis.AAC.1
MQVAVKTQKYKDCELLKPEDPFWPLARYKRKFGNPMSHTNRKLGHKVATVNGHKGVIVPGDDGVGPWKI